MMHTRLVRYTLGASLLAVLAACGGGGDSGSPAASGPLVITADNANNAARVGTTAAGAGTMIGGASTSFGAAMGQQVTISQVRRAHSMAVSALGAQRKPAGTVSVACPGSGSMTISFNDSNADGLLNRVGESISLTANACSDGQGGTADGGFSLTLTSYTDATHLAFTLNFLNFRSNDTASATAAAIDGSISASLSGTSAISATSPSLSISATALGLTRSFSAQNYSLSYSDDGSQVIETVGGTFTSSDFQGQSVQISTLAPIVILAADNYPSQGVLVVTGAGNSSVKVEALNATQAQIYIDANGDGGYETTKVVNWSALD